MSAGHHHHRHGHGNHHHGHGHHHRERASLTARAALASVSMALFLVGLYFHQIFHDTHVYVAQALVVCVAVALWLYWATRFADAPAH